MKLSLRSFISSLLFTDAVAAQGLTADSLEKHANSLTLSNSFNPVKAAYWTGYPHHRRTPFALSPDGKTAYLAYLDSSETDVHVQPVEPTTFAATGTPVTVTGAKEAGGLVAHDDGFALLTNEALPSGTTNAPADSTPVAVLYRFDASGKQSWKTFLGGPGVSTSFGLVSSPDLNGDLVFSETAGYYAAYFVVTAYTGDAAGHFGDAIRYVDTSGKLMTISGASSDWGCSHNTGIALEAADAAPFASLCAEDQGAIWLNTKGQGMSTVGVKVSNENTTNGGSGEPMGGMSGSYSNMARFADSNAYIFAWVSRGAKDLTVNDWMGNGYTHSVNRTNGRNVAIALFSDKNTIVGDQATSVVPSASGDSQVNWVTQSSADCSNAHAAAFDASNALVTWEEIGSPTCDFIAMGCRGTFTGSFFQLVSSDGTKVGEPVKSTDTFVAGDMVTMSDGRICWPYVDMTWTLDKAVGYDAGTTTTKMSFACANLNGASSGGSSSAIPVSSSTAVQASSSPVAVSIVEPAATGSNAATTPTSDIAIPVESTLSVEPTSAALPIGASSSASAFPTVVLPTTRATTRAGGVATTLRTRIRPTHRPSPHAPDAACTPHVRTITRTL